jgi:hypothetical protein
MKKYIIILFCLQHSILCSGQHSTLLTFFNEVRADTILNTLVINEYNDSKNIPDKFVIKYFLGENSDKLYNTDEAYNMDDNTYKTIRYKRTVKPIFFKKINDYALICYWLEEFLYLSTYDMKKDVIVDSYIFSVFYGISDEFTYSILFPNNYIFTIETTDKTRIKLVKIDYISKKFVEQKNIIMGEIVLIGDILRPDNENYKKAIELMGISKTGELLEDN